jgi:hypothetical protein
MSISIEPVVRHMLLCDRAMSDPENPHRIDVFGLANLIVVRPDAVFPFIQPQISVYLELAGGRGRGAGRIVVVQADTEQAVFGSQFHSLDFGTNPLAIVARVFRILDCVFPRPGLYWVEFRYNGKVIAQQPLEVRQRES